jgi:hypothetical protein
MSAEKRIKFTYYQSFGKPTSTLIERRSGILLIGGAEGGESGEYEATEWLLDRARGGNYLVLRFNGIGGQADWIYFRLGWGVGWERRSSAFPAARRTS